MSHTAKETYELFRVSMLENTEEWKTLLADDAVLVGPLAEVAGKDKFIEVNTPFFSSIIESELHEIIEQGDTIITRISTKIALPSGKELTLEVNEWYVIEGGLIQTLHVYFDTFEFRNAMAG